MTGAVDCLSVDISEWDRPGILYGKTAKQCTRTEVAREVWAQFKAAVNDSGRTVLKDTVLHSWFLDPAVTGLGTPNPANEEQLLIHPTGTFHHRPRSATKIPNLFLSGDYVRAHRSGHHGRRQHLGPAGRQRSAGQIGSAAERCTVSPSFGLLSSKRSNTTTAPVTGWGCATPSTWGEGRAGYGAGSVSAGRSGRR